MTLGPQFQQPAIPGIGTESRYKVTPDSPAIKHRAQGRAEHDLNYDKPSWTGVANDPDFDRRDTPRPGMVNVPGQMVMGPHDLSDVGYRHIKNPESQKLGELRRTRLTAEAPQNADLEIRPHGGVFDRKVHDRAGVKSDIYTEFGPQMKRANLPMWEKHGEFRTIKATTPVHSDQEDLRYDPSAQTVPTSSGGSIDNPGQIRGTIKHEGTGSGATGDNGAPKIVKKNDILFQVDGHHRMYEMRNRGMEDIPVHFLDLDKHPEANENKPPTASIATTSRDRAVGNFNNTYDLVGHLRDAHREEGKNGHGYVGGFNTLQNMHSKEHEFMHDMADARVEMGIQPAAKHYHEDAMDFGELPEPEQVNHGMDTAGLKYHLSDIDGHHLAMRNEGRKTMEGIHNDEHHAGDIFEPHTHSPMNNLNVSVQFHTGDLYKSYPGTTQHGRVNRYNQQLDTYHEVRHPKSLASFKPSSEAAKGGDSFVL